MRRGRTATQILGALLATATIIITATAPARAQDYPTRPVEIIVPFAAGGGSELLARLISDGLSKRLGQPFVVLNRPGANTNLGTLAAVRSKPDGYTLLIASIGLAANPSLYKKLAFEPQSDLDERERIVADLGDHKCLIMKHHGLLTAGVNIGEAFNLMYYLEKSCETQMMVLASNQPYSLPTEASCEKSAQIFWGNGRVHDSCQK